MKNLIETGHILLDMKKTIVAMMMKDVDNEIQKELEELSEIVNRILLKTIMEEVK